jgi:hypothetical protein
LTIRDAVPLRGIDEAMDGVNAAQAALVAAVVRARVEVFSWTDVAFVLGVSRQAARHRFATAVGEEAPIVRKISGSKAVRKAAVAKRAAASKAAINCLGFDVRRGADAAGERRAGRPGSSNGSRGGDGRHCAA